MNSDCVIIVGAGPVGLVAAVSLIQNEIPVIVLEASADLAVDLRASTFHPPTLDFLDELNLADGLISSCLLYTSPSPRDRTRSRMPSSA